MRRRYSRLFGAALAIMVPIGGLSLLSSGIASAATNTLTTPSYLTYGTLGRLTLAGTHMTLSTSLGTYTSGAKTMLEYTVYVGEWLSNGTTVTINGRDKLQTSGNVIKFNIGMTFTFNGKLGNGCVATSGAPVFLNKKATGTYTGTLRMETTRATFTAACTSWIKGTIGNKLEFKITL